MSIIIILQRRPDYKSAALWQFCETLRLRPVQCSPVRQELVADAVQSGGVGGAGGVLNAHQIEAGVMGGLGSVERVLAHGAPGGVCAAKAVQRLRDTSAGSAVLSAAEPVALVLLLAVCTAYLVDGSFNPFLYFRF